MRYCPNPMYNKKKNIYFSRDELRHLFWAWIGISIAFGNIIRYSPDIESANISGMSPFVVGFILSAITVGLGFLIHELCHKFVAQRYGLAAEFRASFFMLVLAILMSFAGFVFAAPGAVLIMGNPNRKQNGLISVAGPISNIVLAL